MEIWATVVGTVVALVAFAISSTPHLSPEGARRARIKADLEVLALLPPGDVADRLAATAADDVASMLDRRARRSVSPLIYTAVALYAGALVSYAYIEAAQPDTAGGTALQAAVALLAAVLAVASGGLLLAVATVAVTRFLATVRTRPGRRRATGPEPANPDADAAEPAAPQPSARP